MSFAKRFGIAAAMEELQEQEAAAGDAAPEATGDDTPSEEVDIPVAEDTVETAAAEVDMAESDVDAADETIADAESDLSTLDGIADKLEATEENGGIDAGSAAIVEVAVERLYQKLGVTRAKAMPALESFGADSSRLKATRIAVEDIRENAKKVWEAILRMIAKAREFLSAFFKKVFTATGRVKERAVKLKAALEQIQGNASQTEITEASFAPQLAINKKVSYDDVSSFMETAKESKMVLSLTTMGYEVLKESKVLLDQIKSKQAFESAILSDPAQYTESGLVKSTDTKYGDLPEGYAHYVIPEDKLPAIGGKVVVITAPAEKVTGDSSIDSIKQTSARLVEVEDTSEVKTAPVLSLEQAKRLVDQIIEVCDSFDEAKQISGELEKLTAAISTEIAGGAFKHLIESKEAEVAGRAMVQIRFVGKAADIANKIGMFPTRLAFNTARYSLEWVGQSAKLYGAQAQEPAADEKAPEAAVA